MRRNYKIGPILAQSLAIGALFLGASWLHATVAFALDVNALPSGGQVTGGSASLDYSALGELHVHQNSDRAVIEWNRFDVGTNALTQFHQPGSSSVVVNRITGHGDPTQILGNLRANGIVMVLDRNGVIFGENARVDVGGIIASTGNVNDQAFMQGGGVTLDGINTGGAIINHGSISVTDAGLAAFVAPTIVNSGIIQAKLGRIQIGSGDTATLDLYGDSLLEVAVSDAAMQSAIANTGALQADGGMIQITASAAQGVVNSLINIEGIVSASSATVKGGKIILGADAITVAKDAVLNASGTDGGSVVVYANDTAHIAGTLQATGSTDDNGGFIETSATNRVTIADTAQIDSGGGEWLIDPTNFTIADIGGDITTATLAAQLAANNITIETADAGGDAGDIFVQNNLSWTGDKTLSLKAHRNIEVNAAITNTTGGSLLLRADKNGIGTGTVIFGASGSAAMSGGGRTDLYYNPTAYNTPTNFAANITGTNTAWMLVNDVTQLQAMNTNLAGSYALGRDIDASATSTWNAGAGFNPVGNSTGNAFAGQFDGLDHTISALTIKRPATDNVGLFGFINGATIRNVGLTGVSVTGRAYTGSLVGRLNNAARINNSYSTGNVTGTSNVGGLVGDNNTGTVSSSYATATVSGSGDTIGGLVGRSYGGIITNSYTTGNVNGANYVGGMVGNNTNSSSITNSYATGTASGAVYVGGLLGLNQTNSSITTSYATGTVFGTNSVGGLVGYSATNSTVSDSYATGAVSGSSDKVGGLVGYNITATIYNSYATGAVSGFNYVGGLVGQNHVSGMITDSYATGSVTGSVRLGGLVGWNSANSIVTRSYATGAVSGVSTLGGLVGRSYDGATVVDSYWNIDTTGLSTSDGGTGLTTAQMMDMASFSGWDISDEGGAGTVWRIYEGNTTPLLATFLTPLSVSADDVAVTYYSGTPYSGGSATYSGFKQGDDESELLGTLSYGGTAQGAVNAGTYGISFTSTLYSGQQGYDISYGPTTSTLTIGKRNITATVHDDVRAYGAVNPAWDWSDVTWNNLVGGEDGSVLDSLLVSSSAGVIANAGSAQLISITSFSDNNYNLTGYTPGTLTITKRDISATVHDDTRAYGAANPAWDWSDVTWSNLVDGEDGSVLDALLISSATNAGGPGGSYAIILSGFGDNNYNLTGFTPGVLHVGEKPIAAHPADTVRIMNESMRVPNSLTLTTVPTPREEGSTNVADDKGCLAASDGGGCVVR